MTTRGRFRLHLPGLLKVLAEHLYSTQRVGVRELIQNAHDSCVRRAVEQVDDQYRPRIDLIVRPESHLLQVADNGSGLTEEEIHTYLTVIGRGYTRELRERLAADDLETSRELIGQFGIGFLASYLLASEVTVETRSIRGAALRWFSAGDEQYELTNGNRLEPGTTVELRLKPSAYFLLREQILIDAVREYADFLPTPIYVNNSADHANLGTPPWNETDLETACCEYIRRRFGEAEPLVVLPLGDGKIDLGHDSIQVPLRGFLFVPAESVVSIKEYGTIAVYIRRMAICEADKDLLPPWARFVRGVIDCPALQPTASREAVHQDDAFESVRQVLAEQLSDGLRHLASRRPEVWRRIAYAHSDVIMGWASKDDEFFQMVADSVPLRTSRGRLNLPDYLRASGDVIYFTTRELGSLQDKVLAEGRDVPAIDASWFGIPTFLERYTALHPDIGLVRLDDDLEVLLRPAPAGDFEELCLLCEELGFAVRIALFRPTDLPAVMTYPAGAESVRDAKSALEQGLLPDGFSSLMEDYLLHRRASFRDEGTLHLNAACPLIQKLASPELSPARKQAALATVAYFAKLFCGRMLDASQAAVDLGVWRRSLERLIRTMSDEWREFHQRVDVWQRAGDAERLRLVDLRCEAYRYRETDPERQFALLTQARNEAQRLNEPWWGLLFESDRLGTLTADLHDFARALPLAMELMVRFNSPEGLAHPQRVLVLTGVLYAYLQVDPVGYRGELERGFAQLDGLIGRNPTANRFVLDYRRAEYLCETEQWDEALDVAHQSLALADRCGDPDIQIWHGAWALFLLCEICHALGRFDEVASHATDMEERSGKRIHLVRTRASARIWLAVTQRSKGDERTASRSFHCGMQCLKSLDTREEICAEPIARYYEIGGELKESLSVRERELAVIVKKGMLHRSCRVQIERCRLLSRLGALTPAELGKVRESAAELRVPDWYLQRLSRVVAT